MCANEKGIWGILTNKEIYANVKKYSKVKPVKPVKYI